MSEMRIDYGPGYRVYFVGRGERVVILLCGGDKRGQGRDITHAIHNGFCQGQAVSRVGIGARMS